MSNQELEQIIWEFNEFVFSIEDSKEQLKTLADNLGVRVSLDFSLDSLAGIQLVADRFKKGETGNEIEEWDLINLLAKYLGEVFRMEVGGSWQLEKRKEFAGYGVPGIGKIQGLSQKYIWSPFNVVSNYLQNPQNGFFAHSISSTKNLL